MTTTPSAPLPLWEREERVLRILTRPSRRDLNTVEAERQQRLRMARLRRTVLREAPEETPGPEAQHAPQGGV